MNKLSKLIHETEALIRSLQPLQDVLTPKEREAFHNLIELGNLHSDISQNKPELLPEFHEFFHSKILEFYQIFRRYYESDKDAINFVLTMAYLLYEGSGNAYDNDEIDYEALTALYLKEIEKQQEP